MWRTILIALAMTSLILGGCADDGGSGDSGKAELGASCEVDDECRRGLCDDDVCAMPGQECEEDDECLSFEFCDVGSCSDYCVLMDCQEGHTCERGECIPDEPCPIGSEGCNRCEDLMDCDDYSVCDGGECVSNGDCEPWFTGWFINGEGECEEGGKSGCNYPFPFDSEDACVEGLANMIDECPASSNTFFDDRTLVAGTDLECEYGQECCCGECSPSTVCFADAGETFVCYATDACMIPGCPCEADSDCEDPSDVCNSGFCTAGCDVIDCQEGYQCIRGECKPIDSCDAYWEGAEYIDGACVAQNASGCGNPFTYGSVAACCADYPDATNCDGSTECTSLDDCDTHYICKEGECVHNGDCDAYFSGWYLNSEGACAEGGVSGCDNPFEYDTRDACCSENSGAGNCGAPTCTTIEGCDSKHYCEDGTCVFNGFCDAYFEGWYVDANGTCREGAVSGCNDPFPYESEDSCCSENPDGCESSNDDERACVESGGDWELFPTTCVDSCVTTYEACGQSLTWSCDCGPDGCWNGRECVMNEDGTDCSADSDCELGSVCEEVPGGKKQCVTGCHDDRDCAPGQSCNTDIVCVTTPCPGQCEALADANCGDRTCDPENSYCVVGYGGAPPEDGESNVSYNCAELPSDCANARARCECLQGEDVPSEATECTTDEDGLTTVRYYYP